MTRSFAVVAAVTAEGGIGNGSMLPWHPRRLQLDMSFLHMVTSSRYTLSEGKSTDNPFIEKVSFKEMPSMSNAIIMGRSTWDSIPRKHRPMPGKLNVIVTRDVARFEADNAEFIIDHDRDVEPEHRKAAVAAASSFPAALSVAHSHIDLIRQGGQVFVLGGAMLYREAIAHEGCEAIFLTRLRCGHPQMPCTVFFPMDLISDGPKFFLNSFTNITGCCHSLLKSKCLKVQMLLEDAEQHPSNDSIDANDKSYAVEQEISYQINLLLPFKE